MTFAALHGGFLDRLWILSGGDPVLFLIPCGLASVAAGLTVFFLRDIMREAREQRRRDGIETARRIQAALDARYGAPYGKECAQSLQVRMDARYGARCAKSVAVALRDGRGISEGLHEAADYGDDRAFFAGMRSEGRRGWEG